MEEIPAWKRLQHKLKMACRRAYTIKPELNKPGNTYRDQKGTQYFIAMDGSHRRVDKMKKGE
jgi:hypothetical protein